MVNNTDCNLNDVSYFLPEDEHVGFYVEECSRKLQQIASETYTFEPMVPTGFEPLDRLIGGFKPGKLYTLTSESSYANITLFVTNLILSINRRMKYNTGIDWYSLGESRSSAVNRLLCCQAKVSERSFHDGSFDKSQLTQLQEAEQVLKKSPVFIHSNSVHTVDDLNKISTGCDLIIIDSIFNVIDPMSSGIVGQVNSALSALKDFAKRKNIAVLVTTTSEHITDSERTPELDYLPRFHADMHMVLSSEYNYTSNPVTAETLLAGIPVELDVIKNDNFATGISEFLYYPSQGAFKVKPISGEMHNE